MRHGYKEVHEMGYNPLIKEVKNFNVPTLSGFTVLIRWVITSGEYEGYFIGEEFCGLPHPFLVLPKEIVVREV